MPKGARLRRRPLQRRVEFDLGQRGGKTKNPPCQSARRVSENLLGNSKSSLAVFYVEQVALNRHVFWCGCKTATLAATPANPFMPQRIADVKSVFFRIWTAAQTSLQVPFLRREARRGGPPSKDHKPLASIRAGVLGEYFGDSLTLGTSEAACQILSQQRIALRAGDGFLGVFP